MLMQQWIVALIVLGCTVHATWALMPKALRRRWASRWLGRELAPQAVGCGGCEGCAGSPAAATAKAAQHDVKPLVFHPRAPR